MLTILSFHSLPVYFRKSKIHEEDEEDPKDGTEEEVGRLDSQRRSPICEKHLDNCQPIVLSWLVEILCEYFT